MAIERIKPFIEEKRTEFRKMLENDKKNFDDFIRKALIECCGEFDEKCLAENLKEEYLDFLKNTIK